MEEHGNVFFLLLLGDLSLREAWGNVRGLLKILILI
jgi:hypothetical protein